MGQMEIDHLLKLYPDRWFTTKEISSELNIGRSSVQQSLVRMRKHDEVDFKKIDIHPGNISCLYRYKNHSF